MSRFESLDGLLAHDDNFRQFFTTLIDATSENDHFNATSTANMPLTGGVDDDVAGEADSRNNQIASGNADTYPTSTPDGGTSTVDTSQSTSLSPKSSAACPPRGQHTSEAIERIVGAYVELRNQKALEDLRTHRHRLVTELKSLTRTLDVSSLMKQLESEIAFVDAGLAKFNTAATI